MIVSYVRNETKFEVDTSTLPPASIDYLLQYGFAQSMQDTIAGLAKKKAGELAETTPPMSAQDIADEVDLTLLTQLEKRHAAIVAGTIGVRTSTPRDELSSIAREQVRAALAKKGVKVDKEKLAELVAAHIAKSGDALRAELTRRAANAVDVEIEL